MLRSFIVRTDFSDGAGGDKGAAGAAVSYMCEDDGNATAPCAAYRAAYRIVRRNTRNSAKREGGVGRSERRLRGAVRFCQRLNIFSSLSVKICNF
jgi:hypothetical protein